MNIKKYLLVIPFIVLLFSFSACNAQENQSNNPSTIFVYTNTGPMMILSSTMIIEKTKIITAQFTNTIEQSTKYDLGIQFFWLKKIPNEYISNKSASYADELGYLLEYDYQSMGISIRILGGKEADNYPYCEGKSTPHKNRGVDDCFSMTTGAGYGVEWKERGIHYSVGGMGCSQELTLEIAEQLE
jgi:hypothetical protein